MEYKGANNHERTENLLHGPCKKRGSVWVIKPGQTLQKHYHHNSDDIWIVLQGEGIFYPQPNEEVPFKKGHVIVSKKDSCHGAKNTGDEDIIFVSIVAPVPSDYDPINE